MTEGFQAELEVSGRTLLHVPSNTQFRAILETLPAVSPQEALLGIDPREMTVMHVLRTDCPPIKANDRIQDAEALTQQGGTPPDPQQPPDPAEPGNAAPATWMVTKRDDNFGDVEVRYTLREITDQDA